MTSTGKFLRLAHHFILLRLNLFGIGVDREGWWFSTLCHSCGLAFWQSVLKALPASGYLHFEDRVV